MAKSNTEVKVLLKNVRLSFPTLFKAQQVNGQGDPKFSATALLDPDNKEHAKIIDEIKAKIKATAVAKWGEGKVPKAVKYCLQDGNEKDYDGYEGMLFLPASNKTRPVVVDRGRNPVAEEDGIVYAGCYVNMTVSFWAQDNQFGKRINANLRAVQFVKDGESFGAGHVDAEDEFDILDEMDDDGEDLF
ncbi:MAG: putative helix-destabilizing protein [Prokaryotic dsDNA virus sp.]|nr:hypothetical protein [Cytophagaceae bacterium]QDP54341.1 MAG: putative helix-destabilizing protein [Prokaryotic dsDNA virus sp.]|tara:strand:- start:8919 stop:9482 length:564 start_codon:yes stop_codon:yes gene_type:complete